ncbi:hypothetical protein NC652_038618 [Populus alba x Populus x berolinensis]|nr:hypothetical protein NC652_038618 [Populus alba x Populus x berolinensis]
MEQNSLSKLQPSCSKLPNHTLPLWGCPISTSQRNISFSTSKLSYL